MGGCLLGVWAGVVVVGSDGRAVGCGHSQVQHQVPTARLLHPHSPPTSSDQQPDQIEASHHHTPSHPPSHHSHMDHDKYGIKYPPRLLHHHSPPPCAIANNQIRLASITPHHPITPHYITPHPITPSPARKVRTRDKCSIRNTARLLPPPLAVTNNTS
jgi:hypothetical protein